MYNKNWSSPRAQLHLLGDSKFSNGMGEGEDLTRQIGEGAEGRAFLPAMVPTGTPARAPVPLPLAR